MDQAGLDQAEGGGLRGAAERIFPIRLEIADGASPDVFDNVAYFGLPHQTCSSRSFSVNSGHVPACSGSGEDFESSLTTTLTRALRDWCHHRPDEGRKLIMPGPGSGSTGSEQTLPPT